MVIFEENALGSSSRCTVLGCEGVYITVKLGWRRIQSLLQGSLLLKLQTQLGGESWNPVVLALGFTEKSDKLGVLHAPDV